MLPDPRLQCIHPVSDDASKDDARGQTILEIYKMYAEFADRASQRRLAAASGYLPLLLNVIVVISTLALRSGDNTAIGKPGLTLASLLGVFIAVAWLQDERRWRSLLNAKFAVLIELGSQLPYDPYAAEWKTLAARGRSGGYGPESESACPGYLWSPT